MRGEEGDPAGLGHFAVDRAFRQIPCWGLCQEARSCPARVQEHAGLSCHSSDRHCCGNTALAPGVCGFKEGFKDENRKHREIRQRAKPRHGGVWARQGLPPPCEVVHSLGCALKPESPSLWSHLGGCRLPGGQGLPGAGRIPLRSCADPAGILGEDRLLQPRGTPARLLPLPHPSGFPHLGIAVTQRLHTDGCPPAEMNTSI